MNASRLDYDEKLDFSRLEALCDFRRYDVDLPVAYFHRHQLLLALFDQTFELLPAWP